MVEALIYLHANHFYVEMKGQLQCYRTIIATHLRELFNGRPVALKMLILFICIFNECYCAN
jgi:hypothetical protein